MIYRVLTGYDTGGEPIWKWHCNCEICLATSGQCQKVMAANFNEQGKPQIIAIDESLRR